MTVETGRSSVGGLAYERSGSGDCLVLVHGLGGTGNVWEPLARALADRFTVLRLDLEGSGRSPARGALSIAGWVANLEAILSEERIDKAAFIGHSLGTLVLQHFALRHPDRVRCLALLGVNRAPEDSRRQTVRDRAAKVRREGMIPIAEAVIASALSQSTLDSKPEVIAMVRELLMRQDPEGYARSCEAVADAHGVDLHAIACPVLLVAGEEDKVSPVQVSSAMKSELADARLEVVARCGHWMTLENPPAVLRAVTSFLAECVR